VTTRRTSPGGVIAGVAISVGAFLLVLTFVCSLCQGYRNSRANVPAAAAAAEAALAVRPRPPPPVLPLPPAWDNEYDGSRPRRASPTAGLPSFTYNRSVRHNVTGGGDVLSVPRRVRERGEGAAAAGVPAAPVPRGVHRPVAGRALDVPSWTAGDGSLLPPV
jgi:hypothetical protein